MEEPNLYSNNADIKFPLHDTHTEDIPNDILTGLTLNVPEGVTPKLTGLRVGLGFVFAVFEDSATAVADIRVDDVVPGQIYPLSLSVAGSGFITFGPGAVSREGFFAGDVEVQLEPETVAQLKAQGAALDMHVNGLSYDLANVLEVLSNNELIDITVEDNVVYLDRNDTVIDDVGRIDLLDRAAGGGEDARVFTLADTTPDADGNIDIDIAEEMEKCAPVNSLDIGRGDVISGEVVSLPLDIYFPPKANPDDPCAISGESSTPAEAGEPLSFPVFKEIIYNEDAHAIGTLYTHEVAVSGESSEATSSAAEESSAIESSGLSSEDITSSMFVDLSSAVSSGKESSAPSSGKESSTPSSLPSSGLSSLPSSGVSSLPSSGVSSLPSSGVSSSPFLSSSPSSGFPSEGSSSVPTESSSPGPSAEFNTLLLNGSTQSATAPNIAAYDFSSTGITVNARIKIRSGHSTDQQIISKWHGSPNRSWNLRVNADKTPRFLLSTDGTVGIQIINGATPLVEEQWYHITGRADGTNIQIFIDGVSDGTLVNAGKPFYNSGANLDIGLINDGGGDIEMFDGDIAEVTIFPALSDAQLALVVTDEQPWERSQDIRDLYVAAWTLNTAVADGRRYEDYSGNENDLTAVGSPTFTGSLATFANASTTVDTFLFDGVDDDINCGNAASLQILGNLTLNAWVRPSGNNAFYTIIGKYDGVGSQSSYKLHLLTSARIQGIISTDGAATQSHLTAGAQFSANEWFMVTMVYDGSTIEIFKNGVSLGSSAASGAIFNSTTDVIIGSELGASLHDGSMTKPLIFNRALSAAEVLALYNQNLPKAFDKLPSALQPTDTSCVLALNLDSVDATAVDQSTYGNDGTLNGGVAATGSEIDIDETTGRENDASTLLLNGSSQNTNYATGLLRDLSAFSMFARVYKTASGVMQVISETTQANATSTRLQFSINGSNKLRAFYRYAHAVGTVQVIDPTDFPLNQWVSVGFSMDAATNVASLYVNGIQVITDSGQTITQCEDADSFSGTDVGAFNSVEYFQGSVNEVLFWEEALLEADFATLHNSAVALQPWEIDSSLKSTLAGAWSFNTGVADGRRYEDYSGNERDMVAVGSPTFTGALATFANASTTVDTFLFDGTDDSLSIPDADEFTFTDLTVEVWVKPDSTSEQTLIRDRALGSVGSGIAGISIELISGLISNATLVEDASGNYVRLDGNQVTIPTGVFSHIVMTVISGVMKIYLNGIDQAVTTVSSGTLGSVNNALPMYVGQIESARWLDGSLPRAVIRNRGISAFEVLALYNQNLPKDPDKLPSALRPSDTSCVLWVDADSVNTLAADKSTYAHTVTRNGGIAATGSEIDIDDTQAPEVYSTLLLNGSTQYATIAADASITFGDGTRSIVCYAEVTNTTATLFQHGLASGAAFIDIVIDGNSDISVRVFDNAASFTGQRTYVSDDPLPTTGVFCIGVTYNTWGVFDIYVDGVLQAATASATGAPGNLTTTSEFNIGRRNNGTAFVNGSMGPFMMFNKNLSAAEHLTIANLGSAFQPWELPSALRSELAFAIPLNTGVADGRRYEDYSGNENDATAVGSPTFTGTLATFANASTTVDAFLFDGTDDDITIADNASLDSGTSNFSISFWLRRNLGSVRQYIVTKQKQTASFEGYYIHLDTSNRLQMYILYPDVTNHSVLSAAFTDVLFHHIAISLDRVGNMVLYVDGVVEDTTDISSKSAQDIDNAAALTVGKRSQGLNDLHFDGDLSKMQFFNRSLSASEALALYNQNLPKAFDKLPSDLQPSDTSCILALNLDSVDDTAVDQSTFGNDGTKNGGVAATGSEIDIDDTTGRENDASTLLLNGSSQHLDAGADASLHPSSFSYAAWVKGSTLGNDTVMRQAIGATQDTALMAGWSGLNVAYDKKAVFGLYSGSTWTGQTAVGTTDLDDDAWHFLVGTYDDVTKLTKVYVDGIEEASITIAAPGRNGASDLYVGRYPVSAANYFDGSMALPTMFNRDITPAEVLDLYNTGVALQPWEQSQALRNSYALALALNTGVADGRRYFDYSGNENDATPVGSPTFTGDLLTFANISTTTNTQAFDGVDDYVDFGNDASLQLTGDITLSGWMRTSSDITTDQAIVGKWASGNGYILYVHSSTIKMQINSSPNLASFAVGTNTTYHFTGTYDGANIKIYINGILKDTTAYASSIVDAAANVIVGKYDQPTHLEGDLNKVMVHNRAVSASEALTLYNQAIPRDFDKLPSTLQPSDTSCVLAVDLDGNVNPYTDQSTYGNNGTANGGVTATGSEIDIDETTTFLTYTHTWVNNVDIQSNKADFDGIDDKVTFPHAAAFNFAGDDFTIEWIGTFDAFPDTITTLFAKFGVSDFGYILNVNSSNELEFAYSVDGTILIQPAVTWGPSTATEYYVAVVRDGADLKFYVNGSQQGATQNISTDVINSNTHTQKIGGYHFTDGDMDGQVNYLKVSDVAVTISGNKTELVNDAGTIYLNTFTGANGSTPTLNTE